MKAVLVQPPFTQLNAPYPAVHYLEAFLGSRGISARAYDHSIGLYRLIFSGSGLTRVFAAARNALGDGSAGTKFGKLAREEKAQVTRFLSYERLYIEWIDSIADFLAGGDPAMAHRLASAVELPRGARAEAFLAERDGRIDPEEARALATRIVDDLGDFISFTLDPAFGTVRYAERIAASQADFGQVRAALNSSWLINEFYAPYLDEFWAAQAPDFILVTVPFPGCLLGALACARSAKLHFGRSSNVRPKIILGGGYISTELRGLRDDGIFDFCDFLSFDAGYGSLVSIMERPGEKSGFYRTMTRRGTGGVLVQGFPEGDSAFLDTDPAKTFVACPDEKEYSRVEREAVKTVFPDYGNADFGAYLRVVDSKNSMHRLWSDTPWLKYGLAHGCYWKQCSFCDTELEYVADFSRCDISSLMTAAAKAAGRTGLYGIHFVDEAMPMASLLDFARANRARAASGARSFSFWGNVRFDASWTQDRCEFLAASGLVAVSGGIEIATERGLAMTNKGFDLASLTRTLVSMRRAGLLVHTYLIYGFPGQTPSEIVDSAEFCRQLFVAGLVDSAFWHRFVLTRHSRMYREWRDGNRPELKPIKKAYRFADNDLSFEGEGKFDLFDEPLAAALAAWMEGNNLDEPASVWFGNRAPRSSLKEDFVESLIALADTALESTIVSSGGRAHWIAGIPSAIVGTRGKSALSWTYRGENNSIEIPPAPAESSRISADKIAAILSSPALGVDGMPMGELLAALALPPRAIARLRSSGLVVV